MLKLFVDVVTPLLVQVIGLIKIDWVSSSNFTFINVEVPIPTDDLGVKFRFITSPSLKLWAVDSETTASTRCKVPVTWVGLSCLYPQQMIIHLLKLLDQLVLRFQCNHLIFL